MYDVRPEPLQHNVNKFETRSAPGRGDQTQQKQYRYNGKGGSLSLSAPAGRLNSGQPGQRKVRARMKKGR